METNLRGQVFVAWVGLALLAAGLAGCAPSEPMTSTVTVFAPPFNSSAACEKARAAAGSCSTFLIKTPDARCVAFCKANFFYTQSKVTKASSTAGAACTPHDTTPPTWDYSCVNEATCQCL